jgi:hypothetical protein
MPPNLKRLQLRSPVRRVRLRSETVLPWHLAKAARCGPLGLAAWHAIRPGLMSVMGGNPDATRTWQFVSV